MAHGPWRAVDVAPFEALLVHLPQHLAEQLYLPSVGCPVSGSLRGNGAIVVLPRRGDQRLTDSGCRWARTWCWGSGRSSSVSRDSRRRRISASEECLEPGFECLAHD